MLEVTSPLVLIGVVLTGLVWIIVRVRLERKASSTEALIAPLMARHAVILHELDKLSEMFDTEAEGIAILKASRLTEEMQSINRQIAEIKSS